jgi:hypothetical protein
MLSLPQSLSKKSDDQPLVAPAWHPNFRNFERLPDTKVVRTAFFVNTASIAVAAILLLWVGYRSYEFWELGRQIAGAEQQIKSNAKANAEALRHSKVFADEEKKIQEALAFTQTPFEPSNFVAALGKALPKEIAIDMVDMRPGEATNPVVVVRGSIAGTPDQAAGIANSFLDQLRAHARFAAAFDQVDVTNLTKGAGADTKGGSLTFEIVMRYKVPAKEKEKEKKK